MLEEAREKLGSVLFSALGAWLGLGAGLAMMIFSLLAVSPLILKSDRSDTPAVRLNSSLGVDLVSVLPEGVNLADDGTMLKLQVKDDENLPREISYSVWEGRLSRNSQDGESEVVVQLDSLSFSIDGNRLYATWKSGRSSGREVWAIKRWTK